MSVECSSWVWKGTTATLRSGSRCSTRGECLRAIADHGVVVMVFEDLQWAERACWTSSSTSWTGRASGRSTSSPSRGPSCSTGASTGGGSASFTSLVSTRSMTSPCVTCSPAGCPAFPRRRPATCSSRGGHPVVRRGDGAMLLSEGLVTEVEARTARWRTSGTCRSPRPWTALSLRGWTASTRLTGRDWSPHR